MSKRGVVIVSIGAYGVSITLLRKAIQVVQINIWVALFITIIFFTGWIAIINYIFRKYKIAGYNDSETLKVDFFNIEDVSDKVLKYAVIMTKHHDKWIFVRHKERSTWEIPGGRREPNEAILKTAERELVEESGAKSFDLSPICVYSVTQKNEKSYGLLCYAEILEFGNPLEMEICEVKAFDEMPEALTYPQIQPELFKKVTLSTHLD